jgi:hypothetical protein
MQQAHISALQHRHADIEARIEEESQRPLPDMATLSKLKKEKLWIKEEIAGLHSAGTDPPLPAREGPEVGPSLDYPPLTPPLQGGEFGALLAVALVNRRG